MRKKPTSAYENILIYYIDLVVSLMMATKGNQNTYEVHNDYNVINSYIFI